MEREIVIERAIEVIGTKEGALEWLQHMSATLGAKPIDMLDTESGRILVMLHLAGIARNSVTDL